MEHPSLLQRAGRRVDQLDYLPRWLILGIVIGIAAGLGAVVFYEALRLATYLFLDRIGGYVVPTPAGEGGVVGSAGFSRPWAIPLTVGLGGLLSGLVVFGLAPEAEGHGTDAAIDAFHHHPKGIRARVSAIKIVASALTIGSGGSGGREGPTGQISAGFASLLGAKAGLCDETTRLGVAAGIGSGIGAIFSAPLGGTILGPEILYENDFESKALLPSLVASVVAFAIFGLDVGYGALFGSHESYGFHLSDVGYYVIIGLLAGVLGRAYSTGFYGLTAVIHKVHLPRAVRPALAGVVVGAGALVIPQILSTGYGNVQKAMGPSLLGLPLWLILVVPLARIAATGLSIGSGGSGGIFGPGMVIGAFTGAAVWRVAFEMGLAVPHEPAPFVIIGMAACFGGISRAPIAVLVMVTEMTGSIHLMLASLMALAIAVVITGRQNIYKAQLDNREVAPSLTLSAPIGTTVSVGEIATLPRLVLGQDDSVPEALSRLQALELPGAAVVDRVGTYEGSVQRDHLAQLLSGGTSPATIEQVFDRHAASVGADLSLAGAAEAVETAPGGWLPVVDARRKLVGIVSANELVAGYRLDLTARHTPDHGGRVLIELQIEAGSDIVGRRVGDLGLPSGSLVVALSRQDRPLVPTAETEVQPHDTLGVLTRAEDVVSVRQYLATDPEQGVPEKGHGIGSGGLI